MKLFSVMFLAVFSVFLSTQSNAQDIFLDGKVDEWDGIEVIASDPSGDGQVFDFRSLKAANGRGKLSLLLEVRPEFKLLDNNRLTIYIDGDNNPATGLNVGDIGAELEFTFGERSGFFHHNGVQTDLHWSEAGFQSLPTVTDTKNEIVFAEDAEINGTRIFSSDTIRMVLTDKAPNGDRMPDLGSAQYVFDRTQLPPLEPITLEREDAGHLRIMNYNVEFDGLLDPERQPNFSRVLNAIKPDIICFNEFFNTALEPVLVAMNTILPLDNGSWYGSKKDNGNITVSKYPILNSWNIVQGRRVSASLIDLPEPYAQDIIVINSHFKCCDGDEQRQKEADGIVSWLLDGKTSGGTIDFDYGLPYLILGDLNLVGFRQQLTTLLTGDIVNVNLYGQGAPPDWNDSNMADLISRQTGANSAVTWFNPGSSFPPGRLDFMIYSNSVLRVEKSYILRTETMSQDQLTEYDLQQFDTGTASDHLPKVADFTIVPLAENKDGSSLLQDNELYQNYPNPFNPTTRIDFSIAGTDQVLLKVYDMLGQEISTLLNDELQSGHHQILFNARNLASGVYFYRISAGDYSDTKEMILLR